MARDELYDGDWIEFYDKLIPEEHYHASFKIIRHVISKFNPAAKDILELACGTGRYSKYFVRSGLKLTGVDISSAAIHRAKKRAQGATFRVADMTSIRANKEFDIVACMFESWRYHKSFSESLGTLQQMFIALRPNGLFFCDFGVFPPSKKPDSPQIHNEVAISGGRLVVRDEMIYTKGVFDVRFDHVKVFKKTLFGKQKLRLEKDVTRAPLLRFSEHKMKELLKQAGFENIKVIRGFAPAPRPECSVLFVGQKL